jgi:hypothetical protein
MDEDIKWVKVTQQEIATFMQKLNIKVSRNIVKKLLKKHEFVKRKMLNKIRCGNFPERDKQFEIIQTKLKEFKQSENPVISIDAKSREPLGRLFRRGQVYGRRAIEVYDHSYDHLATGIVISHGIYDLKKNKAHINIGTTHGTTVFLCDSLQNWWGKHGKVDYPNANEILIFCDAGGANSWLINAFKVGLQRLCDTIQVSITICHYPPYTSKWNPIEHRVFPHVTRAMEGVVLDSHEQVQKLIEKTTTKTGLKVTVDIIKKVYELGKTVPKKLLEHVNIKYGEEVSGLNYSIYPSLA